MRIIWHPYPCSICDMNWIFPTPFMSTFENFLTNFSIKIFLGHSGLLSGLIICKRARSKNFLSILARSLNGLDFAGHGPTNATASMTHEVVTAMSNDAHVIQDVLSEKVLFLLPCLLSFSLLSIRWSSLSSNFQVSSVQSPQPSLDPMSWARVQA